LAYCLGSLTWSAGSLTGFLSRVDKKLFAKVTSDMIVRWKLPYNVSLSERKSRSAVCCELSCVKLLVFRVAVMVFWKDGLPGSRFEMSRGSDDAQPDGKSQAEILPRPMSFT
jgi:hypothetical protein